MSQISEVRSRILSLLRRRARPGLEWLEDRWVPSANALAMREVPAATANTLPTGDDLSSAAIPLGFTVNVYGNNYNSVFVNNNGNVSFDNPFESHNTLPLQLTGRVMFNPFFGNVDTRADGAGQVVYGQGTVEGRRAFFVTWDGVGYQNQHADRTNTFQLVLIERSDVRANDFDMEFNYGRITWDRADTTGGGSVEVSARVGWSIGRDEVFHYYELPGSAIPGAFLDGSPSSLVTGSAGSDVPGRFAFVSRGGALTPHIPPTLDPVADQSIREGETLRVRLNATDPDPGQTLTYSLRENPGGNAAINPQTGELTWTPGRDYLPGEYFFRVQVQDSDTSPLVDSQEFRVSLKDVPPVLFLATPVAPFTAVGTEFVLPGFVQEPGMRNWRVEVSYGDGSPVKTLFVADDGTFTLRHTYADEGNFPISVMVIGGSGTLGSAKTSIIVLPNVNVEVSRIITAAPGESAGFTVVSPKQKATLDIELQRAEGDGEDLATLFLGVYQAAPFQTTRTGTFFDVQYTNGSDNDVLELTFSRNDLRGGYKFGFFDRTSGKWVDLLAANPFVEIIQSDFTGTMIVRFKLTDFLTGTVFTVSLPPAAPSTTTGNIRPPTAQGNTGFGTTDSSGQTRSLSFNSNAQLSLALTASRDNQLSANINGRGSQAGEVSQGSNSSGALAKAVISSTSGVGGGSKEAESTDEAKAEEAAFWRWLLSEEGLQELMLNGIDPALLIPKQEEVGLVLPEAEQAPDVAPDAAATVDAIAAGEAEAQDEIDVAEMPADITERSDAAHAGAVLAPVLLAGQLARPRRRKKLVAEA